MKGCCTEVVTHGRAAAAIALISGVLASESCLFDAGPPVCLDSTHCIQNPLSADEPHSVDTDAHMTLVSDSNMVDAGAMYEHGNRVTDAASSADASWGPILIEGCGNGIVETAQGEQCDPGDMDGDGSPDNTRTCDADCTRPVCGDGVVNPHTGEQCDPGDGDTGKGVPVDTAHCDADCTLPVCGDGHPNARFVNPATGRLEDCDEGKSSFACDRDCTYPHCGDGFLNLALGEACDDGNEEAGDACPTGPFGTCQFATCGDGFLRKAQEACDVYHEDQCGPGTFCCLADCTCKPRGSTCRSR